MTSVYITTRKIFLDVYFYPRKLLDRTSWRDRPKRNKNEHKIVVYLNLIDLNDANSLRFIFPLIPNLLKIFTVFSFFHNHFREKRKMWNIIKMSVSVYVPSRKKHLPKRCGKELLLPKWVRCCMCYCFLWL